MVGAMDIIKNASETIFKRLVWHTAKRDQAGIAEKLANEQEVHEIYGLGDAGLFDDFFSFLRELGIMKVLEQLAPRRHSKRQSPVPFPAVMLIYLMRIVAGLKFFYHTGPVLLQSQSLMHLVGFNGHQVKQGVNRRSLDKSKTDWEDKNNTAIRGPVCPEFIASFIVAIAIDRGFMCGKLLWWLNSKGIIFYIPAKSNQNVYDDALSLVETGLRVTRERKKTTGHGKNRKQATDTWDVVGLEGLTTAGFYGELGSGSHENKKDFRPNPINAVVVLHDPYREKNPDVKTLVILTNGLVSKPLKVYDGYDARSEIENSLFRESKQGWFIKRPPENSKAGFLVHAYLTILTMALTRAFRDWMIHQEELEDAGEDTGIRKFRQKVRQENSNKCIVFHHARYAIFYLYEILILCGKTVLKPRGVPDKITREDILRKHGALLE